MFVDTTQVVYGFYGMSDNDGLPTEDPLNDNKEGQYAISPDFIFRPDYILLWPLKPTTITHLQVNGQEQLMGPVSADAWKTDYPLDMMIDRYFDNIPKKEGIKTLIEYPIDIGRVGIAVDLPTLSIGSRLAMSWEGKLRGLLLIGRTPKNGI